MTEWINKEIPLYSHRLTIVLTRMWYHPVLARVWLVHDLFCEPDVITTWVDILWHNWSASTSREIFIHVAQKLTKIGGWPTKCLTGITPNVFSRRKTVISSLWCHFLQQQEWTRFTTVSYDVRKSATKIWCGTKTQVYRERGVLWEWEDNIGLGSMCKSQFLSLPL